MNFKRSQFALQDKNAKDINNATEYPTLADLIKEQNLQSDNANMVHYRRDLDALD